DRKAFQVRAETVVHKSLVPGELVPRAGPGDGRSEGVAGDQDAGVAPRAVEARAVAGDAPAADLLAVKGLAAGPLHDEAAVPDHQPFGAVPRGRRMVDVVGVGHVVEI